MVTMMTMIMYYHTGKSYGILDVIATLCMTIGLIFFTLADSLVQPNFNLTGGCGWLCIHGNCADLHRCGVDLNGIMC